MRNLKYISGVFAILLILGSCTEKIEIELDSNYERLSVEGIVTTDSVHHYVKLTRSKDYYSGSNVAGVSGASVKISDGVQTITLQEKSGQPGYYETPEAFRGVIGRTYNLDIELTETIGEHKEYSASCELKPIGTIDSIGVEYRDDWEVFMVNIYAQEPPTTDYYIFQVYRNGELKTDTVDEYFISDDRFYNGAYTNGIMVGFLDAEDENEALSSGDTVTLRMSSITREYFDFIFQLQDQTFQYRNPLFSGPPANIISNIPNATGFFAAYSSVYSSMIYEE